MKDLIGGGATGLLAAVGVVTLVSGNPVIGGALVVAGIIVGVITFPRSLYS